jgi:hypothetical protein
MRKLPFLLSLLLLSLLLLAAAASAHAVTLPGVATQAPPFVSPPEEETEADEEGEAEGESGESQSEEGENCGPEEDELCEEEGETEAEECLIEDADASFTAAPGAGEVRLRVHYRAFEPTAVIVDASLRGNKGSLHLGNERVRFHRAGVYRDIFKLGSKQMAKAVAAKEFEVSLRAVGAPAECEMDLATRGPRRAK